MEKLVIASTRHNAGKTSLIIGIAKSLNKSYAYMKPFGDRLLYKKKRLWDYDASLVSFLFKLDAPDDEITIGFDHSKLRYMFDEEGLKNKIIDNAANLGKNADILFIEGAMDIMHAYSVHLDAFSVARYIEGKLVFIMSGGDDAIIDDITFIRRYAEREKIELKGVILNKVHDVEDFKNTHLETIKKIGINVFGIIPFRPELNYFSVDYLSEALFARVVAGEGGLNNIVTTIFVGSVSSDEALRNPSFTAPGKLVITSGDRSDLLLAALHSDTSAVIITNNILPPSNIISKASERNIPVLIVSTDEYQTARKIDSLQPLLTKASVRKIDLLKELVINNINLDDLVRG